MSIDWAVWIDYGLRGVLAIGGLAGVAALLTVVQQRRTVASNAGKTDAEANLILTDVANKPVDSHTERADRLLTMQERFMEKAMQNMQKRLDDTEAQLGDALGRLDQLTTYVEVLVQALRGHGHPVPAMPRKMADEARTGSHPPSDPAMRVVRP